MHQLGQVRCEQRSHVILGRLDSDPSLIGVAGGLSPATILGSLLAGWYRSDLGVTLGTNGVSAWADQSGNGRNAVQNAGSQQPSYTSGLAGSAKLSFALSSTQSLTAAALALSQPFEIISVLGLTSIGAGNFQLLNSITRIASTTVVQNGLGNNCNFPITCPLTGAPFVLDTLFNYPTWTTGLDANTPVNPSFGTPTNNSISGMTLGNATTSSNTALGGDIYESIFIEGTMSSAQRAALNQYLSSIYGVA